MLLVSAKDFQMTIKHNYQYSAMVIHP